LRGFVFSNIFIYNLIFTNAQSKLRICNFAKIVEMNTIQLKNIKIYAFHGCLPEEEKIGSDYIVNLSVKANLDKASKSDELTDTVDYVLLQKIVAEQMAIRSKLLEHVGKRIIDKILLEVSQVNYIKIMVAKVNPPIDGDVELVSVTLTKKR
tara:strand:- start:29268 stop:29723 length:456 start_codon:yes stop_codon:yes gene_type:complete